MKYLADVLTFSRMILALALGVIAVAGGEPDVAFVIFLAAELTDVFDGTCARKWPFPKGREPGYRKYAALFDMIADVMLAGTQVLYVLMRVNLVVGIVAVSYYALCAVVDLIVYGKLLGHPDNYTPRSLVARNFLLAKKIILARRLVYAVCIGVLNAFILFATSWGLAVKWVLFGVGCSIAVFAWFFLRQRRKNVSRDAVEIENKLAKDAKKKARK